MTCSKKNAHTEARDVRCPHVNELKQSIFKSLPGRMCTPGGVNEARVPDSDVVPFPQNIPVSRRSTPLPFLRDFCVSTTALPWGRWHVHQCCCLRIGKQATAPSPPSLHSCCRQHVQKLQKPQLLISEETKNAQLRSSAQSTPAWLSICAVSSKLLTQSAPSPLSSSDRHDASPSERFKKRQLEKKTVLRDVSCEMTTGHTSLAAAIALSNLTVSPFTSSRSPCRWTVDRAWDTPRQGEESTAPMGNTLQAN